MNKFIIMAFLTLIPFAFFSCNEDSTTVTEEPEVFVVPEIIDTANTLDVRYRHMSLLNKMTATWCGPCGTWGWTLFHNLIEHNYGKVVFMGTYSSSTSRLHTPVAAQFFSSFSAGSGVPSFCLNAKNETVYAEQGGVSSGRTQDTIDLMASRIYTEAPIANASYMTSFDGSKLKIDTRSKFYENTNGDFYLGVYIIENEVQEVQSGHEGLTSHSYVLRASVAGDAWGEPLISGSVKKGKIIEKSFEYEIPGTWYRDHLSIALVIWNKEGDVYKFVNAYTRYKL